MESVMQSYRLRLQPRSAFGTPLKGDTLFGQLCWALRNRHGEAKLTELLDGYTDARPFAVLSDAFPAGHVPRPTLPLNFFVQPDEDQKRLKKCHWLTLETLQKPLPSWLGQAKDESKILPKRQKVQHRQPQPHNTIDRRTGTTGEGQFAPYTMAQTWYVSGLTFDVYLLLDEGRLELADVQQALTDVGTFGFGRDASIGLGKFDLLDFTTWQWPTVERANAYLTLAPCAPQGLPLQAERCYYTPFTRFGRHGDSAVQRRNPFKNPVLLADTGAVLSVVQTNQSFFGQGLGGNRQLSKAIDETVQQGYAPVIPIHLPAPQQDAA